MKDDKDISGILAGGDTFEVGDKVRYVNPNFYSPKEVYVNGTVTSKDNGKLVVVRDHLPGDTTGPVWLDPEDVRKITSDLKQASGPGILPTSIRKKLNGILHGFGTHYHDGIPMVQIIDMLAREGVVVLDDDGSPWQGFLTGADGRADFDLAVNGVRVNNSSLVMFWHKMDVSGKYEITAYVS